MGNKKERLNIVNWIINFYDILMKSKEIMSDFSYTTVDERKEAYEIYKIAFNALLKSNVTHIFNDDFTQLNINGEVFILKNDTDESFLEDKESVSSYNNYIKSKEEQEEDYDELTQEDSLVDNSGQKDSNDEKKEVYHDESKFIEDVSPEEFPTSEPSDVEFSAENDDISNEELDDDVNDDHIDEISENKDFSVDESPMDKNFVDEDLSYEESPSPYENLEGENNFEEPSFDEGFIDEPNFDNEDEPVFSNNFEADEPEIINEIITDEESDEDDDLEVNIDESLLDYPDYPSFMHYKDFTLSKNFVTINVGENLEPMKMIIMLVPLRNDIERPDYMFTVFKQGETELNVVENTDNPFVYSIFENDAQYDILIDLFIENGKVKTDIRVAKFTLEESRYLILGEEYEIKTKEDFGNGDKGHIVLYDDTNTKRIHIAPVQEKNGKYGRANLVFYIESLIDDDENFIGDTSRARNSDGTYKPSFQLGDELYSINSKYKDGILYSMVDKY